MALVRVLTEDEVRDGYTDGTASIKELSKFLNLIKLK